MAVKFINKTDTLETFRSTFNEMCAEDFGDISYSMGDMGCASVTNGGLGGF